MKNYCYYKKIWLCGYCYQSVGII